VLKAGLGKLEKQFGRVFQNVRGRGLYFGADFLGDTKKFRELAYEKGLLVNFCSEKVLRVAPPLVIDVATIKEGLAILDDVLRTLYEG